LGNLSGVPSENLFRKGDAREKREKV